jgi:small subunit ribosomal protein S1
MRRVRDLQPYVGKELEAKIIELDKNRNNVVLSRRQWLEETQSEVRSSFLGQLQKGQVRSGQVSSIVNFGAFVDLGGVDGLVHVSELSWKHIDHPSEVVEVGQDVTVEVLDIEGLVHISELAERHVEIPEQVVNVGEELLVKVIDIDLERRRISLSLKQANENGVITVEHFDPAQYGMAASYDENGNYIYPEGFDPETNEWLPGHDEAKAAWEQQYAEAQKRFEQHQAQISRMQAADAEASEATSYSSATGEDGAEGTDGAAAPASDASASSGSLATDEALQALRDKLSGGESAS